MVDDFVGSHIDELRQLVTDAKQGLLLVVLCAFPCRVYDKRFIENKLSLLPQYCIVAVITQGEADGQLYFYFQGLIL